MEAPSIVVRTARLRLRRFVPDDLEPLARLYADPEVRRYFPDGTRSRQETWEELTWFLHGHPRRPELGLWAAERTEDGAFLGRCGLLPWTIDGREEVEVAYLLDPRYWGRGFATEAARGIVRHAFDDLGLHRLVSLIDPANERSQRVAERIGMRLERTVPGIDGDGIPTRIYALERSDDLALAGRAP